MKKNQDLLLKDLMDMKCFIVFVNDFKLQPFLLNKEETVKVFNYLDGSK